MTAASILSKHTVRPTSARLAVLQYFLKAPFPVSVSDVADDPAIRRESIDTVTLYRMMDTFVAKGILEKLELNEGKFRYELAGRDHHHHVLCTECGSMADVSDCLHTDTVVTVTQKTKFQIVSHALTFYGVCPTCQKEKGI